MIWKSHDSSRSPVLDFLVTFCSNSQIDWVLMVLKFYSVPGYVKLPFGLSVLQMEAADLGFPGVWTQMVLQVVS